MIPEKEERTRDVFMHSDYCVRTTRDYYASVENPICSAADAGMGVLPVGEAVEFYEVSSHARELYAL